MTRDVAEQFKPGGWAFTSDVVAVFDEHVRASVPHYDLIQGVVADVSDWLLPAGGTFVDLGCATGTTAAALAARHPGRDVTWWLYDEQPEMLHQARLKLAPLVDPDRLHLETARIQHGPYTHRDADLTVALFTLQFLPPPARLNTLTLARQHSADHGALLVAEKVLPTDPRWAEIATDCSHDWKAAHGITPDAIRAKARALRGVLRPAPVNALHAQIRTAGWSNPETLFRWHNWTLTAAHATPATQATPPTYRPNP